MFVYIMLILIVILLIPFIKKRLKFKQHINSFAGPSDTHPIMGDIWVFSTKPEEIFQQFRDMSKKFPNSFRLWSIWHGVICINTAEYAEVLLSNVRYIRKSLVYNHLHPWLKTGLLTSTGKKWFQRRKLLTPAFHFNILKKLTENFAEHNEYLLELLKDECKKDKTDVMPLISTVALNIICGTSMGVSLNNDNENNNKYREAIYSFPEILTSRTVKPWLVIDFIFRFHPLYKVQEKLLKVLHGFTSDIIRKREEEYHDNVFEEEDSYSKKKLAMLDLLLNAKHKTGEIDDEGIREEGHDTVSSAISFALMLIANHKLHQEKIIQEIDAIFGDSNREITFQDLQNMPYLEICLKESLRLYPSVPFMSRRAEEDIFLDENHTIPNTSLVHVHIYDIHRNPKYFPEPEKFLPERFLPENCKNRHPYAYIPFSAGPRNCIGQKYAMLEMKSIIVTILRYYELEPIDTPESLILSMEMVLRCRNGIHVKFLTRNK